MSSTITVRKIDQGELEALLDLYHDLSPNDPPLNQEEAQQIFRHLLRSEEVDIWVAVRTEVIVATCVAITVPNLTRGGRPFVVIENVVTKREFRNQGIGKALLQHVITLAKEHGAYKVMLQTGSSNPATHAFYKSLGFRDNEKVAYVIREQVPKVQH
jgi:ribosomal protein S18 acetylase RimI-like enzyme